MALQNLVAAKAAQPTKIDGIIQYATKLYADEGRNQAIEWLRASEPEELEDIQVKFLLGKYILGSNQPADGISLLEEILKANQAHLNTLLELGHFYLKPGNIVKASAYFQKAANLFPKSPEVQISYGSFYQRKGDLSVAVEHYRNGLTLQLKNQVLRNDPPPKDDFKILEAEKVLWDTLALMCRHGIHMHPISGSLLGIVREGKLMEHDKDIDTGLPFTELDRALKIMSNHGWVEVYRSFGYMNPRAMVHTRSGISMDISGFVIDSVTSKSIAGAWMPGIPKDWNMINEFTPYGLKKIDTPDKKGQAWFPENPELWLEEVYGEWRIPDKNFDTMVRARNIVGFPLLLRCFAYSRIFKFWVDGNFKRARALSVSTFEHDQNDHLLRKIISRLSN